MLPRLLGYEDFTVPRLAIVIPATGPIAALENSLVSVLEHRPDDCEVIVVLNQRYADPYDLAGEVTFIQARSRAGLVACVNRGLLATQADLVHVLKAGCEVTENWTDPAIQRFNDPRVAAVAPSVLNSSNSELLCQGVELLPGGARRLHGGEAAATNPPPQAMTWGPALFAAFYRVAALKAVGGLSTAAGDEFADVDLNCSLGRAGYSVALEASSRVMADAAEVMPRGGRLRRAWQSQRLFGRTVAAFGWPRSILGLTAVVGRELLATLPNPLIIGQITARLLAGCDVGHYHRHQLRFRQLTTSPAAPPREPQLAREGSATREALSTREPDYRRLDRSHAPARRAETAATKVNAS